MGQLARTDSTISDVFGFFNLLDENTSALIEIMPTLTDERLIDLSEKAGKFGNAAWRIEAAAHYEIVNRCEARRGKKGEGQRNLIVEAAAKDAHLDASTIRRNAQIFRTFLLDPPEEVLNVQNLLPDKGYYEAALRWKVDPVGALLNFADIKEQRPFGVREAHRMVIERTTPGLSEIIESAGYVPGVEQGFRAFRDGCRALAEVAPLLRGTLSGYVSDIEHELTRPAQTIRERIMVKVSEGCQTVEDFAREFSRPRVHMEALLRHMVEDGLLIEGEEERAPGARGAAKKVYKWAVGKRYTPRLSPIEMALSDDDDDDDVI